MHDSFRDEVLGLLAPHLDLTDLGDAAVDGVRTRAGLLDAIPDLARRRQTLSHMGLAEAAQAGIVMYGDASFSIDVYGMERLPSFAHFVASMIVHGAHGARLLRGLELEAFTPHKGWKTLFGSFAKGVNANNIFSGKRLGPPSRACRILSTGNEQLYALECPGTYATLLLQTSEAAAPQGSHLIWSFRACSWHRGRSHVEVPGETTSIRMRPGHGRGDPAGGLQR